MNIKHLKSYIYDNNKIEDILQELKMHKLKWHDNKRYITCAFPDGDNPSGCVIYNSEYLNIESYTRNIENKSGYKPDLLSLVEFIKQDSFFSCMQWICQIIGIDYYYDFDNDIPESLRITKLLNEMQQDDFNNDNKPLKPIPEQILSYYCPYVNDFFHQDNIDYLTQLEFEISYDPETNRITIPIRDELGNLCGVKGRLLKQEIQENELKYIYLEPCGRSKILYGLHKTYQFIKQKGCVYIGESEKFCLQLWSMGIYNSVGIGGKKISSQQIEKLTRLSVDIIICFDKDVTKKEIENIADRFIDGVNIYYLFDDKGILPEKTSPSDNPEYWQRLTKECLYKIK
jgi:DNA primase